MELGRKIVEDIWRIKGEIYDKASFGHTRLGQGNESGAIGGVLSMKYEDKKWRPVAYISNLLNEAERNYEIHDKKMLAIIWCLEAWRYFLEGAKD